MWLAELEPGSAGMLSLPKAMQVVEPSKHPEEPKATEKGYSSVHGSFRGVREEETWNSGCGGAKERSIQCPMVVAVWKH